MDKKKKDEDSSVVLVGGTRGHVEEYIRGDLLVLWRAPFCDWKPIKNCTGRYTCREKKKHQPPPKTIANTGGQDPENEIDQPPQEDTSAVVLIPSTLSPLDLMRHAHAAAAAAKNKEILATNNNHSDADSHNDYKTYEFGPPRGRVDRIIVLPLDPDKTTGTITYVKEEEDDEEEHNSSNYSDQSPKQASPTTNHFTSQQRRRRFVHTLNAPSGFQRKLKAVGIQLD